MSVPDRETRLFAISPSWMPLSTVTTADVMVVDVDGVNRNGRRKPNGETAPHTKVMPAHDRVEAIVQTHSHDSTVVSTIKDELPPQF